jgi:hypothetical protein
MSVVEMMRLNAFVYLLLALLVSGCEAQQDRTPEARNGWSRATPNGSQVAAVYGQLTNPGTQSVAIAAVHTPVARMAQVHESLVVDGMMQMRHVDPVELPAGSDLNLVPGGLHLMLMGLTQPLTTGMTFDVVFELADGQQLTLPVVVGTIDQIEAPAP